MRVSVELTSLIHFAACESGFEALIVLDGKIVSYPYNRCVIFGLLCASLLVPYSVAAEETKVKVLVLGDSGFHKPSEICRHLADLLAKRSIEHRCTEDSSDINADKTVLETRSSESGPVRDPDSEPYTWVRTSGKGRVFY